MKNNIQFFILLLTIVLFYKCTKQINSPASDDYISVNLEDKLLRIQDSTTVDINIADHNDSTFAVQWSTNMGNIKGAGAKVKYIAPNIKGSAIINAKISDRDNKIYTYSKEILIYKQIVFLKADDIIVDASTIISTRWKSFIEYIRLKKIKASLGLIGDSLRKTNTAYYFYLKNVAFDDCFEIWNHGYNHLINGIDENGAIYHEFWNTSYEYQKEHLFRTQYLAKAKLGVTLRTFGAPGNNIDDNTLKAIEEIDEIKVWYFGSENFSKLNIGRSILIEFPTFTPDFQQFISTYNAENPYLALQIHPNAWDESRFLEFKKIIDFLIQNDVTFLRPYEYYQLIN